MADFGLEVTNLHISARGTLTIETARAFAIEVVEAIGMTCSHDAEVFDYPAKDGVYIGFVLIQPLIESYVVIDYWANHQAFYMNITSCKGIKEELIGLG